jgi:hypothetical protein
MADQKLMLVVRRPAGKVLSEAGMSRSFGEHRMAHILLWLFGCSAAVVSSLASADLLLCDRQRKWINDRAIDFWNWLDDQRELNYLGYLRGFRWQRFVAILYSMFALLLALVTGYRMYSGEIVSPDPLRVPYLGHHLLGALVASFFAALIMVRALAPVLNWVTKTEGSWAYIGRSLPMLFAAIAAFFAFCLVLDILRHPNGEPVIFDDVFLDTASKFSDPMAAIIAGFCLMFILTPAFITFICWVLVVLPVILILLLMILFRVVLFIALRVAENPKGPQYALSVLLAAVAAGVSRLT